MSAYHGVSLRWFMNCVLGVILLGAGDRMWSHFAERAAAIVIASIQSPAW
jgi:hypothetical protein